MSKICCEDFKWRHETSPEMGLNIRAARLVVDSKPADIAFFITEGYTKNSAGVKYCKIDFCPFCGKKLSKIYRNNSSIINSKIEDFARL